MRSVWRNDKTLVPAGNMLGKDFVSGFIAMAFFLTRYPCRIVTTSADGSQLEAVLWGEIRRFIQQASVPLDVGRGGPLIVNHLHIRRVWNGEVCPLSYCMGRVAAKGEGMLGHHIAKQGDGVPRTLFIADEASGVDNLTYRTALTWADRVLGIGNCRSTGNWFEEETEAGDLLAA